MGKALKILVYAISSVLFFLGIIFMISVNLGIIYFLEGFIFLAAGLLLLIITREKKPIETKQTVTLSGSIDVREIRCPICSAIIDPTKAQMINGKPYATCKYCGNKFELTEDPIW